MKVLAFFFFLMSNLALCSDFSSDINKLLQKKEYQEAISLYKQKIFSDPMKESDYLLEVALIYLKDQEVESAFKSFLNALAAISFKNSYKAKNSEMQYYEKALDIYLDLNKTPAELSREIREEFEPVLNDHSEYHSLGFLVAASYANLHMYDYFMRLFYTSYKNFPDHYLSHRTKGAIYLKLMNLCSSKVEKEQQVNKAYEAFQVALEMNPRDVLLYRLTYTLCPKEEKAELLKQHLKMICNGDYAISRKDIFPFVKEGVETGNLELAQRLVEKAKTWYPYSRAILTSQEYIAKKMKETSYIKG